MPKSRTHKKKKNREFLMLNDKYVKSNYIKWLDLAVKHITKVTDLTQAELYFLLFAYDYEWFTKSKIAEDYGRSEKKLYENILLPLRKKGYLENYYNHGKTSADIEQSLGITHTPDKIGMAHKGRHAVQRFYRMLDGSEDIEYHN